MSESEIEEAYQKIVKDLKLGEFLWPAIEEKLESGEIQFKNGSIICSPAKSGPLRGKTTSEIWFADE